MSDQITTHGDPSELQKETWISLTMEKAELQGPAVARAGRISEFPERVEKERGELYEYASMEAVRALLPVLDDFERSLKAESSDKEYVKGWELIYQRFYDG